MFGTSTKPNRNGKRDGHSVYTGVCIIEFGWVYSVFVLGLGLTDSCFENASSGFKV